MSVFLSATKIWSTTDTALPSIPAPRARLLYTQSASSSSSKGESETENTKEKEGRKDVFYSANDDDVFEEDKHQDNRFLYFVLCNVDSEKKCIAHAALVRLPERDLHRYAQLQMCMGLF